MASKNFTPYLAVDNGKVFSFESRRNPRQSYQRISPEQLATIYEQINRCMGHWVFAGGDREHIFNRIRASANIHRLEELRAVDFDSIMQMIKDIEITNLEFLEFIWSIRKTYVQDYIEGGAPWAPHLKRQWSKKYKTELPERPDWRKVIEDLGISCQANAKAEYDDL